MSFFLLYRRKIHPKKQSVNAYIVFKDEEGVAKALERSDTHRKPDHWTLTNSSSKSVFVCFDRNGMEIEKDFYIRVDRVTDNSSVSLHHHSFIWNNLWRVLILILSVLSCSMTTNVLFSWGIFRSVSFSAAFCSHSKFHFDTRAAF